MTGDGGGTYCSPVPIFGRAREERGSVSPVDPMVPTLQQLSLQATETPGLLSQPPGPFPPIAGTQQRDRRKSSFGIGPLGDSFGEGRPVQLQHSLSLTVPLPNVRDLDHEAHLEDLMADWTGEINPQYLDKAVRVVQAEREGRRPSVFPEMIM